MELQLFILEAPKLIRIAPRHVVSQSVSHLLSTHVTTGDHWDQCNQVCDLFESIIIPQVG